MSSKLKELLVNRGILPAATTILLLCIIFVDVYSDYVAAKDAKSIIYISSGAIALIHELQKERGLTAGYLASKSNQEALSQLKEQRVNVEQAYKEFLVNQKKSMAIYDDIKFASINNKIIALYDKLSSSIRVKVDDNLLTASEAIGFYNILIEKCNRLVSSTGELVSDKQLKRRIASLSSFSLYKDNLGLDRALFNIVYTKGYMDDKIRVKIHNLSGAKKAYMVLANNYADPQVYKLYESIHTSSLNKRSQYLMNLALDGNKDEINTVSSYVWFRDQTDFINLIRDIEIDVLGLIEARNNEIIKSDRNKIVLIFGILVLFAALIVWGQIEQSKAYNILDINYRALLNSKNAMFIYDKNINVIFINIKAKEILYSAGIYDGISQVEGKSIFSVVDFSERLKKSITTLSYTKQVDTLGSLKVSYSITPLKNSDNEVVSYVFEATEQR